MILCHLWLISFPRNPTLNLSWCSNGNRKANEKHVGILATCTAKHAYKNFYRSGKHVEKKERQPFTTRGICAWRPWKGFLEPEFRWHRVLRRSSRNSWYFKLIVTDVEEISSIYESKSKWSWSILGKMIGSIASVFSAEYSKDASELSKVPTIW